MKSLLLTLLFLCSITNLAACPFCNAGVIDKQLVFENQHLMVLHDNAPIIKGHLLIIPKRHVAKAHELSPEEWAQFAKTLPQVVNVFREALNTDQYLLLEKNGPYAGQTVSHAHFHAIPIPCHTIEDSVKITLFSKMFNVAPSKLKDEELKEEVAFFRQCFTSLSQ